MASIRRSGYGDRILYGTDQIGYGIEVIESAPWDEKVKRAFST